MFKRLFLVHFLVLFLWVAPVNAQIRMGLAEFYSNNMDVSGVTAEYLYNRKWGNALSLRHPEREEASAISCHETLSLLEEGYTPLGLRDRARIITCSLLRDVASLQPYEHNLLHELNNGLWRDFPNYAPAIVASLAFYVDIPLQESEQTWSELGGIGYVADHNFTKSPWQIVIDTDSGINYYLTLMDIGDYNGDGYADAVIEYYLRYFGENPSYPHRLRLPGSGHFILSRTSEEDDSMSLIGWHHYGVFNGLDLADLERAYATGDKNLRRDVGYIEMMLDEVPLKYNNPYSHLDRDFIIEQERITSYNNIAYYLEQSGDYEPAILILNKIVGKVPNRTVAYINLGDAYWGLEQHTEAREAYQTYIHLMRESNREQRIPQRVLDRVGG